MDWVVFYFLVGVQLFTGFAIIAFVIVAGYYIIMMFFRLMFSWVGASFIIALTLFAIFTRL